jgi:hypothetical protein
MKTAAKLIFLALGLFLLLQGWHVGTDPDLPFDYAASWAINGGLLSCIFLDLSWFGILAVLSDATVRLFNRWAASIKNPASSN